MNTWGRASSSSSEFANRVARADLGGALVNFALGGVFLFVEKNEYRSPPVGPRRVLRIVPFEEPDERGRCSRGDSLRSVGDWTRTLAPEAPDLIVRRMEWVSARGEERLKLLEESLPFDIFRRRVPGIPACPPTLWKTGPRDSGRGLALLLRGEVSLLDQRGSSIRDALFTSTDIGRVRMVGCVRTLGFWAAALRVCNWVGTGGYVEPSSWPTEEAGDSSTRRLTVP